MIGPLRAGALAEMLEELCRAGCLPRCGEPYPLAPEFCCTHPAGHDGLHGYDGPFPPEENL